MARTEAQKRATANYRKKMKNVGLEFSPNEMDLYDHLCKQTSKAGYIKDLIRSEIESEQDGKDYPS